MLETLRRAREALHVPRVGRVALRQRAPRVAGREPVGLRVQEGDLLSGCVAQIVAGERRGPQRPAGVVAVGTVTAGSRMPATSLPSASVFGTSTVYGVPSAVGGRTVRMP